MKAQRWIPSAILGTLTLLWFVFGLGSSTVGFHLFQAYGILGGALVGAASPLFLEDWEFQPMGILGWFAGIAAAIAGFELFPQYKFTEALFVPLFSVAGIILGALHAGQRIRSNIWMPLLVSYFILGVWLDYVIPGSLSVNTLAGEVMALVITLGILQIGTGLILGWSRQKTN